MKSALEQKRPIELLLIDNSEDEIYAITMALQQTGIPIRLRVMRDGDDAITFLHPQDDLRPVQVPKLILIEADHLECHGFDVLEDLKAHPDLASIPVVLLTEEDHGVLPSYYQGTCSVVPKPLNPEKLQKVLPRRN